MDWNEARETNIAGADASAFGFDVSKEISEVLSRTASLDRLDPSFQNLLDALPVAVYLTDAQGRLTHFNEAAIGLSGRVPELGTDHWCVSWKLYHADGSSMPHDQCPMAVAIKEERPIRGVEAIAERPDGTRIWFEPHPTPIFNDRGEVIGGINMLLDLTERKQAEAEREAELRDSKLLQEVSAAISREDDVESLYRKIMDAAVSIMGSDYASMQRFHPERGAHGELKLLATHGFNAEAEKFWEWVSADSPCICGMAMKAGSRAIVPDVRSCEAWAGTDALAAYLEGGILACQSTPLISRSGRLIGMISTHWSQPHDPSTRSLRLLDVLARQAADLIERAQIESERQELFAKQSEAREEAETLNEVAQTLSSELDLQSLLQNVTDAARKLTAAKFAAFFYNEETAAGDGYKLCTLSGARREDFERFGIPRNTALFEPTFRGESIVRSDDVSRHADYGKNSPYSGLPPGHLPVTSYLAVPVVSRSGDVLGGLLFGHPDPGVFTDQAERIAVGIAGHAAIAIDNARLFRKAELEIEQRKRTEGLIADQNRTLEALALGKDLDDILATVTEAMEAGFPGSRASILLADAEEKRLFNGAARSLPDEYNNAIEGIEIGEGVGSCGTASYRREPVIVSDIGTDPLWENFRDLAARFNLAACWSYPIVEPGGKLLGTFGLYFDEPRDAHSEELAVIESAARIAGIAIHRKRAEENAHRQYQRANILSSALEDILAARDSDAIARDLFSKVAAHLDVDTFFNYIVDKSGKAMSLHAYAGIPEDVAHDIEKLEFDQAICGTVASTRQPIVATDIQNSDYDKADLVRSFGIDSYVCNPLIVGDRLVGTLSFASRSRKSFEEDELVFLHSISQYAAIAIDRLRREKDLQESNEREKAARHAAEAANRAKDDFLANLSHELRTPLNAMRGWSDLLQNNIGDQQLLTKGLDSIGRSVRLQNALIEDLLDVSRIISGNLSLEKESLSFTALVQNALDSIRPIAQQQGIYIGANLDLDSDEMVGDKYRLQQIVGNLLTNAVKFTPSEGTVVVSLKRRATNAVLTVVDSGIGMQAEFLPHIFDRFSQGESGRKRKFGGLGLGLTIVKHLVEAHGGSISAHSDGEGKGATFVVELPLVAKELRSPDGVPSRNGVVRDANSLEGTSILVVDDNSDTLELMFYALKLRGADVTCCGNVPSALEALGQDHFDLVISDIGMPEVDGFDLIRRIRENPSNGNKIPAIALSGFVTADDRAAVLEAGFQMHLPKPVDFEELARAVQHLIRN